MLTFPVGPTPEVMVLGAGFSKSLSVLMPLTDDLGDRVLAIVRPQTEIPIPNRPFENGRFEAWLSRIAEDQPDLTNTENLSNRVLFELCSQSLASVLDDCVLNARDDALSHPWLFDFIGTLHARRSTVITFNQDTLIELAVEASDVHAWDQSLWRLDRPQPKIRWWDCIDGLPPFTATRLGYGVPLPTMRLLKVHGSTNWYWRAGDESGATTASWFPPGMLPADQALPSEAAVIRRELPGRVPLIVPPAATKSAFYRTPLLNQLWQDAHKALSQAQVRVALIGYSIPPTDLVTSGMLRETLFERDHVSMLDVINPHPDPVIANLQTMGADPDLINTYGSVGAFVADYLDRAAHEIVTAFRKSNFEDTSSYLLTGADIEHSRKIVAIGACVQGELDLTIEDSEPPYTGPNVPPSGKPSALALPQLLAALENPEIERLAVVTRSGERRLVVGAAPFMRDWGAMNGKWQVLITTRSVE